MVGCSGSNGAGGVAVLVHRGVDLALDPEEHVVQGRHALPRRQRHDDVTLPRCRRPPREQSSAVEVGVDELAGLLDERLYPLFRGLYARSPEE